MKNFRTRIKGKTQQLFAIQGNITEIAKGYSLGIFLATTPFVGLKVFIALFLAAVLRWNKAASVIGVYHINPVTGPPFYALAFLVGSTLLGVHEQFVFPHDTILSTLLQLFTGAGNVFFSLLLGGLILGIPLTFIAYLLAKRLLLLKQRVNYSSREDAKTPGKTYGQGVFLS